MENETKIFVIIAKAVYDELPSCIRNNVFLMDFNGIDVTLGPTNQKTVDMIVNEYDSINSPESTGIEVYSEVVN